MRCKVCSEMAEVYFRGLILGNYSIAYYRCNACGFIQTEEPYWLEDAYSSAITGSDTGLVRRNLNLSRITQAIISLWFNPSRCFLDFAGGYGLLVRLMRDVGYDFRWYDKYCDNLLAKGFEADVSGKCSYELVTAFEVFEHMSDPLAEIERIAGYSRNILFSTEIIPENLVKPESWWYLSMNHGQHVSLFSLNSLQIISRKLSLNFYTNGSSLHLFTEKSLPTFFFKLSTCSLFAQMYNIIFRRKSLVVEDAKSLGCNL